MVAVACEKSKPELDPSTAEPTGNHTTNLDEGNMEALVTNDILTL